MSTAPVLMERLNRVLEPLADFPASVVMASVRLFADPAPEYVFNGIALRYRDPKTGRFVSEATLLAQRDQLAAAYEQRMAAVGKAAPNLGAAGTVGSLTRHATNANILGYTMGRGGVKQMSDDDWARLGEINAHTRERIASSGFADPATIATWTEPQREAFAAYHAGDSVAAFEQGRASMYGVKLPAHPGDGSTPCGGHCRCRWEYASELKADGSGYEHVAYWQSVDDGRTCAPCAARGSTWAPYRTGVASGPNSCAVVLPSPATFAAPVPGICSMPAPAWSPLMSEADAAAWLAHQGGGTEGWLVVPKDYEAQVVHGQPGISFKNGQWAGGEFVDMPNGGALKFYTDEKMAQEKAFEWQNAAGMGDSQQTGDGGLHSEFTAMPAVITSKNSVPAAQLIQSTAAYKKIKPEDVTFEMLAVAAKKGGYDGISWDDGSIMPLGTSGKVVIKKPAPPPAKGPSLTPKANPNAPPPPPLDSYTGTAVVYLPKGGLASWKDAEKFQNELDADIGSVKDNLPAHVSAGVSDYLTAEMGTTHGYVNVNAYLRGDPPGGKWIVKHEAEIQQTIKAVDAAIDQGGIVIDDQTTLFRGLGSAPDAYGLSKPGDVFKDNAFVSVGPSKHIAQDYAQEGGTMLEIEIPAGQVALPAWSFPAVSSPGELLLPRGLSFQVQSVTPHQLPNGKSVSLVKVKIVPDGTPPSTPLPTPTPPPAASVAPAVHPPPAPAAVPSASKGHPVTNGIEWQPVMDKDDALTWAGKKKDGYGVEFWTTVSDGEADWAYIADSLDINPSGLGNHMPPFNKYDVSTVAWSKDGAHAAYANASGLSTAKPKDQPPGSTDVAFVTSVKSSKIVTWPQAEKMINAGLFPHIEQDYDGFIKGVKGAGYEAFEYKPAGNKNTYLSVFDPKKLVAIHPDAPMAVGGGQGSPLGGAAAAPSVPAGVTPMPKVTPKKSSKVTPPADFDAPLVAAPGERVPRPVSKAAREAYAAGRIRRNTRSHQVVNRDLSDIARRAVPAQDFIRRRNRPGDRANKKWELDTLPLRDQTPTVQAKKDINAALGKRMYDDDAAVGAGLLEYDSPYTYDALELAGHPFREMLPARLRDDYDEQVRLQKIGAGYAPDADLSLVYGGGKVLSQARARIAERFTQEDFEEFGRAARVALKAVPTEDKNIASFLSNRSDQYVRSWAATSYKTPLANSLQYAAQEEFQLGTVGRKVQRPSDAEHGPVPAVVFKQRFVRVMYDETQARLDAAGIDRVTLFRGHGKNVEGVDRAEIVKRSKEYWPDIDAKGEVMLQGISSFSSSAQVASRFWGNAGAPYIVADVPREMILGSARTGFGCLNEEEFVVLGGRLEVSLVADGEAYDIMREQEKYIPQNANPSRVPLLTEGVPILKDANWAAPAHDPGWEDEF